MFEWIFDWVEKKFKTRNVGYLTGIKKCFKPS